MATAKKTKKKAAPETQENAPEVIATPVTSTPTPPTARKLSRSNTDKVICGVCGGLGEYLSLDPVIFRLLFVILALSGGSGVLIYIILCIVLPEKASIGKSTREVVTENTKNLEQTIEDVAANVEAVAAKKNTQTWIGIGIIILGAFLMANNFGILDFSDMVRIFFRTLWPLAIIGVGLVILTRSKHE